MSFTLEVYNGENLPEIAIHQLTSSLPEMGWTSTQFTAERDNKLSKYFLFYKNHTLIGYVCGLQIIDEFEIVRVYIFPEHREKGHGHRLLQEVLTTLAEEVNIFHLEVRANNQAARQVYRQAQFKEVGLRKNYYINPKDDAIMMALTINRKEN